MDVRWHLWKQAHDSGVICGETHDQSSAGSPNRWRWMATCNLPPDHELPHEDRRGYGTVIHAVWPWQKLPDRRDG